MFYREAPWSTSSVAVWNPWARGATAGAMNKATSTSSTQEKGPLLLSGLPGPPPLGWLSVAQGWELQTILWTDLRNLQAGHTIPWEDRTERLEEKVHWASGKNVEAVGEEQGVNPLRWDVEARPSLQGLQHTKHLRDIKLAPKGSSKLAVNQGRRVMDGEELHAGAWTTPAGSPRYGCLIVVRIETHTDPRKHRRRCVQVHHKMRKAKNPFPKLYLSHFQHIRHFVTIYITFFSKEMNVHIF